MLRAFSLQSGSSQRSSPRCARAQVRDLQAQASSLELELRSRQMAVHDAQALAAQRLEAAVRWLRQGCSGNTVRLQALSASPVVFGILALPAGRVCPRMVSGILCCKMCSGQLLRFPPTPLPLLH